MNESSIPTPQRFKEALLALRPLNEHHMKMLRSHFHAPGHRMSATQLAEAAGYTDYAAANLHYGKLGRAVAEYLSMTPLQISEHGEPLYTSILAIGEPGVGEGVGAHYTWTMRPELIAALSELPWGFKSKP